MRPLQLPWAAPTDRWLICLELQAIHGAHQEPMQSARRLLGHARRNGWPVVHVHLRPSQAARASLRPVEGCEPRPSEPVFFRDGAPTTPDHPFWRLARAANGSQALLCGVISDPWSIRSIEATGRIGVHLSLVREAVAGLAPPSFSQHFDWMGLGQAMAARPAWPPEAANAP